MTLFDLRELLAELQREGGPGCEVQLRHDRELMVFNREGQMVGESIVLVRGPEQDDAS